jgi:hypothetical protein
MIIYGIANEDIAKGQMIAVTRDGKVVRYVNHDNSSNGIGIAKSGCKKNERVKVAIYGYAFIADSYFQDLKNMISECT